MIKCTYIFCSLCISTLHRSMRHCAKPNITVRPCHSSTWLESELDTAVWLSPFASRNLNVLPGPIRVSIRIVSLASCALFLRDQHPPLSIPLLLLKLPETAALVALLWRLKG